MIRVLLIEDNPGDADLIREIAEDGSEPATIERVARLSDGLDRVSGGQYDAVITDLGLPDTKGIEAVETLRKAAPQLPVVVLTGSSGRDQAVEVLRAGADDYLVKGRIDADGLDRSLRYAIERRSAVRRAEQAIREEARVVATLQRIGGLLASELNLDSIAQIVIDEATALAGAELGAFLYNAPEETTTAPLHAFSGRAREAFNGQSQAMLRFEPSLLGSDVVRIEDISRAGRHPDAEPYTGMPPGHPVRSYLAVPVISRDGEVLGGLFFGHPEPGAFEERTERVVTGIAGWAAVAMDNARLYEAERRARKAAEDANRAKADFLATMSHELRTPLSAMIGYTDLWLLGIPAALPEAMMEQVRRVRLSARRLLGLIEEILTFSRIEAARETVELETVALSDLVEAVAAVVEPLALAKEIGFRLHYARSRRVLRTDSRKCRQILINLASNAVKFTDAGEVSLEVLERSDDVVFRIHDTGTGIAPDALEKVFEPFWQVRNSTHDRPSGTGLGLAVSRRLARLMGGDITVTSRVGDGSTFEVCLPLIPPDAVEDEGATASTERSSVG